MSKKRAASPAETGPRKRQKSGFEILLRPDSVTLGKDAAEDVRDTILSVIKQKGSARVIFATGASQFHFLEALTSMKDIPWDKVYAFHLDEYAKLPITHDASFRKFLNDRLFNKVTPRMAEVNLLDASAEDLDAECERYTTRLLEDDIDLVCLGIGENGHIAFNDPPVADLKDPKMVKLVELDDGCRRQQLGEGWFPTLDDVPTHALTLTVPAIMRCLRLSIVVPDKRKAEAVRHALMWPVGTACPATVLRTHSDARLWLDEAAASLWKESIIASDTGDGSVEVPVPGFVDIQANGYLNVCFTDTALTEEDCVRSFRGILTDCAAAFLPTTITASRATYAHVLPLLARVCRMPEFAGVVPGIHCEGPFISRADGARGCHPLEFVAAPSAAYLDEMQELAQGCIRLITIAADVEGSEELCRHAVSRGIVVAIGHHNANIEQVARLAAAGATLLTHLGNGLPPTIPRHDSALVAGLGEDRLNASIITDGHHLPAALIKTIVRTKGASRLTVVSDMTPATGMPPGRYRYFGLEAILDDTGALRDTRTGFFAGSSSTVLKCVNYLASLGLLSVEQLLDIGFFNPLRIIGANPHTVLAATSGKRRLRYSFERGFY